MKKLLIVALFVNALLLTGRLWQEMPVNAQVGGGDPACEQDRTLHSIDSNADGSVDLSDAVHLLTWLFSGGPEPQVCLAQAGNGIVLTPEQAEILSHMSIVRIPTETDEEGNVLGTAKTIRFSGVNVQIVNGLGATQSTNGLGNLIVGYNGLSSFIPPPCPNPEDQFCNGVDCADPSDRFFGFCEGTPVFNMRTGSHNVVVGHENNHSGFGGLVVGIDNHISGSYSTVSGGEGNTASGLASTVSGGSGNTASGGWSSVSGGASNTASGLRSSVSGGGGRNGGEGNIAVGDFSTVSGGRGVTVQDEAGHAP